MEEVTLESLVGKHTLDAVDMDTTEVETWGSNYDIAEVIRFRLDGVLYVAVEDPDDGYRSALGSLAVSEEMPKNVFPAIQVIGIYRTESPGRYRSGSDDILDLVDVETGKVILSVGTGDTDNYYPYFVSDFRPENMITNQD